MMYQKICIVLVLFISGCLGLSLFPPDFHPPTNTNNECAARLCSQGTVCRLQQVLCVRPPCYLKSTCIPPRRTITKCPIEQPILGANLLDIVCSSDARCPTGTYCRKERYGRRGGCCLRDVAQAPLEPLEKPGFCRPPTLGFGGKCISRCSSDSQCPDFQKCCSNGCGRTCQNVLHHQIVVKPGSCPAMNRNRSLRLRCARPCSSDGECSGQQKCCQSGGCGRICRNPVNGPSICPFWNPNCNFQ